MNAQHPNDPLHGISLKAIVEDLVARRGWDDLASLIEIRCFAHEPSLKSSLKFLRKTPWARKRVEELYIEDQRIIARNKKRNARRASMRAYRAEQERLEQEKLADEATTRTRQGPNDEAIKDSVEHD